MHRFKLDGKIALVTGGNGGIGQGIAKGLLECGATVVIAGRDEAKNSRAVSELAKIGATVSSIRLDVTDRDQCKLAVEETVRRHGALHILVNNAGISNGGGPQTPDQISLESWDKVINTNLTSVLVMSQLAHPAIKAAGGGKIINLGSMASFVGSSIWTAYGSAKGGVVQLTKNCASAWAKDNIQVNTIWPGLIETDMTRERLLANKAFMDHTLARTAASRVGTPDDFAGVAAFLASSASDFITGADITVDGGLLWGV